MTKAIFVVLDGGSPKHRKARLTQYTKVNIFNKIYSYRWDLLHELSICSQVQWLLSQANKPNIERR